MLTLIMADRLTDSEKEIIRQFEDGRLLQEIIRSQGWQLVLDIMETQVKRTEFQLMNYDGADKEVLTALHRRARTTREFFESVQKQIAARVEAAMKLPEQIEQRLSDPIGLEAY